MSQGYIQHADRFTEEEIMEGMKVVLEGTMAHHKVEPDSRFRGLQARRVQRLGFVPRMPYCDIEGTVAHHRFDPDSYFPGL